MADVPQLAKAQICELDANFAEEINQDSWTYVQFNPDSMKVSFANQIAQPPGPGDQNGPQAQQFVGAGSTKLAVTLNFDVTSSFPPGLDETDDVRDLTQKVAYFITPKADPPGSKPKKFIPPSVSFRWGSFRFDGIMESMEENLELFSFEGRPLRANVAITLTQQKITAFQFSNVPDPPAATLQGGAPAGSYPMNEAKSGTSLQNMVANQPGMGPGSDWQSVALANGIENPRLLQPGQLINLNPANVGINAGASLGGSASVSASVQFG
jgi:hypothetical protein